MMTPKTIPFRKLAAALAAAVLATAARAEVLQPDRIESAPDAKVTVAADGRVFVTSPGKVDEVTLVWNRRHAPSTLYFRNDWERTYTEAGWTRLSDDGGMGSAWYCLIREPDGRTDGWGVEVQPNALCWWQVAPEAIRLTLDVRAGASPVNLKGRSLLAAKLVMRRGRPGEDAWRAARVFCRLMCPDPRLPKEPVYGYNDWYCAYGENTATNFLADAGLVTSLCRGLVYRPYVVMDDGWQKNAPPVVRPLGFGSSGWGPWDESGERFGMKMKPFAEAVAKLGAKPGLWYRPYRAWDGIPDGMRLRAQPIFFDPSAKGVTEQFAADIARFRAWGMKLVKIDYLVGDVAGALAFPRKFGGRPVKADRIWRDDSRTTCEVLLEQYRAMRAAAGDGVVLIACNAFDHLIAGIFDVQRTGGDTSGLKWKQTRDYGVNSLAARSPHDQAFYAADADCVGLAWANAVDWSLNRQWLDLVSRSGTPLFVSWRRQLATPDVREALREAFAHASRPVQTAVPLDWETSKTPQDWRFADGSVAHYEWDSLAAMGPGLLVVAADLKDKAALNRLSDCMHKFRADYAVVPPYLRNAENDAYARARSSRLLDTTEVPDYATRERFFDLESKTRTRGRELAHGIVAATPVMALACHPTVYIRDRAFKFLRAFPTVYDETRVLADGLVARRAGSAWYVAYESRGEKPQTVTVDLSFLGAGERRLFGFYGKDGVENRKVRTDEKLSYDVTGAGDGFALRLTPPVTLFLAGDSTLSPRRAWKPNGSWGEELAAEVRDDVYIVNGSWGGRSSKSLRGLGHWREEIAPYIGPGDRVILQFGANDAVKNQPYRSTTPYEYSTNLANYVSEIRAKGGEAIICSPITARRYGRDGKWGAKNSLQPYIDAAAKIAGELKVPYVDMADLTARLVERAGFENSKRLYCCWYNGTDNVHPTKEGARRFAAAFADYLRAHPENGAASLIRPSAHGPGEPVFRVPDGLGLSPQLAVKELKTHLAGKAESVPYTFVFGRPDGEAEPKPFTSHYRVRGRTVWFWGDDAGTEEKIDFGESRGHHPDPLRHGTLFAVELFAERELGYRWIWPGKGGTFVERVKTLALPETADGTFETPLPMAHVRNYLEYGCVPWREVRWMPTELYDAPQWTSFGERGIWQMRQRMQDRDIFRYGHAFTDWQDRFGKTHPEYLALCRNSKTGRDERGYTAHWRGGSKHCVACPGVADQIVADWRAKGAPKYLNVCENDGTFWCECEACRALDEPKPTVEELRANTARLTDRYVHLWNAIAKRAVAVRPDVMLISYAYSAYRYAPRREKLEYGENMLLGFVFGDTDDWKRELDAWKAAGMRHFFFRPNHLHIMSTIPPGLARYFYDQFREMLKYGMLGCDYDACANRRPLSLEFYTIARLCANPEESFETIMDDFCKPYGAAAKEVRAYFEAVERDGGRARDLAERRKILGPDQFDSEPARKVPIFNAFGRSEKDLTEKRDLAANIYARHRYANDLTDDQLANLRLLALDAEHAVLVYRFFLAAERAPIGELRACVDRLQAFRLDHCGELPDEWSRYYRCWWAEIQVWKHANKRLAAGK